MQQDCIKNKPHLTERITFSLNFIVCLMNDYGCIRRVLLQIKEMPIRGESLETTRRGWLVVEGKEVTEHARTRLGDPNEKLFIFDIQNAIAGPFFPPSSFEKRREEERRK